MRYAAQGGPLEDAAQVTLHLGRDEFTGLLQDVPMERDAGGVWMATFTVPDSIKWHLAFCFFDPERGVWHNNHAQNWQALVAREW